MFIIKDKKNKTITYDEGDAYTYKKVVYGCYSSEYDDEENREEAEIALYNELSQLNGNSTVKAALLKLCEAIEELTE